MKEKKWNDTTDGTGDKFWKNKPNWWESQAKKAKDEKVKVRPTGQCFRTRGTVAHTHTPRRLVCRRTFDRLARGGGDVGILSGGGSRPVLTLLLHASTSCVWGAPYSHNQTPGHSRALARALALGLRDGPWRCGRMRTGRTSMRMTRTRGSEPHHKQTRFVPHHDSTC